MKLPDLVVGGVYKPEDIVAYSTSIDLLCARCLFSHPIGKTCVLTFQYHLVPIDDLLVTIVDFQQSYEPYLSARRKVNKIKKLITDGEFCFPAYMHKGSVTEGRHRLVAFYELGMKSFPVFIISAEWKDEI